MANIPSRNPICHIYFNSKNKIKKGISRIEGEVLKELMILHPDKKPS